MEKHNIQKMNSSEFFNTIFPEFAQRTQKIMDEVEKLNDDWFKALEQKTNATETIQKELALIDYLEAETRESEDLTDFQCRLSEVKQLMLLTLEA